MNIIDKMYFGLYKFYIFDRFFEKYHVEKIKQFY